MFIETPYIKINPEMFCSSVRTGQYCTVDQHSTLLLIKLTNPFPLSGNLGDFVGLKNIAQLMKYFLF